MRVKSNLSLIVLAISFSLNSFAAGWVTPTTKIKCELFDSQESLVWEKSHTVNISRAGITNLSYTSEDESVKAEVKIEVVHKTFGSNDTYRVNLLKLTAANMVAKRENFGAGIKIKTEGLYEKLSLESADGALKYQLNCFSR